MILCSKSRYFNDPCGPGKDFSESQQPHVELKDDNEEAVEAMLRWLYTFDYEMHIVGKKPVNLTPATVAHEARVVLDKPDKTLNFHLNVCVVANKYSLAALEKEAITRLQAGLMSATEDAFVTVFDKVWNADVGYSDEIVETVDACRDRRLHALLQHPAFHSLMAEDAELCVEIIDKLREGMDSTSFTTGLLEKQYMKCPYCKSSLLTEKTEPAIPLVCSNQACGRKMTASACRQCWMKPVW